MSTSYVLLVEKQNKDIILFQYLSVSIYFLHLSYPFPKNDLWKLFLKQWLFCIFLNCILLKVFTMNKIQLMFIIPSFHVCDFCYLLKFICYPEINTCGAISVIQRHAQNNKKFESPDLHVPS